MTMTSNYKDTIARIGLLLLTIAVLAFGLLAIGASGPATAATTEQGGLDSGGVGPDLDDAPSSDTMTMTAEQVDPPAEQDTEQGNESDEWAERELEHTLGDLDVRATEWVEEDGNVKLRIWLQWHGRAPEQVTVTQVPKKGDSFAISQHRLRPGEKTMIEVDVVSKGMALLYTESSLERQRGIKLNPNPDSGTETTLIRGMAIGTFVFGLATVANAYRRRQTDGQPKEGFEG